MAMWPLVQAGSDRQRFLDPLPPIGLRTHPANRIVSVAGATILVNPTTGNWLRLSPRGAHLLNILSHQQPVPLGPSDSRRASFANEEVETFARMLVRGRFACETAGAFPSTARIRGTDGGASGKGPARGFPPNVMLNVTRRCNLRCTHCGVYAAGPVDGPTSHIAIASRPQRARISREESTGQILALIEKIAQLGATRLVLFGGEPLVRRDIGQVLSFAARRIAHVCLFTNGTLLTDRNCRQIAACVDQVRVSLDGPCAEVNDATRGTGSYERTVQGIRRLRSLGHTGIVIKTVVSEKNAAHVPRMVALAKKLRVALEVTEFVPLGRGTLDSVSLSGTPAALLHAYQCLWLLAEYYEVPSASFNVFARRFMSRAGKNCGTGAGYVFVDASGDIFPCEALQYWPLRMGNLLDGERAGPSRAFSPSVDGYQRCATCELRYFCKAGCAAESYVSGGQRPCSLCDFYRQALPLVIARFDPNASSWHNLQRVFGDTIDASMLKDHLH